jgi:hypothetical protein
VLKLFSNGSLDWQKSYGGTSDDIARKIIATGGSSSFLRGYLVTGQTQSFSASNKDAWTLRLNATGVVLWEKKYGGSQNEYMESACETSDGGYVTVGCTNSWGAGNYDVWAVKFNSTGSVVWQKTYGGSNYEYGQAVQLTIDNGFLIAAYTASFGVSNNYEDIWLLKLESNGSIDWQKTYGGSGNEYPLSGVQLSENSYVIAGSTSTFGAGSTDCWVLKLGFEGQITFDYNSGAYIGITSVSPGSYNCTIGSVNETVTTTMRSNGDSSATKDIIDSTVETQATDSFSWY